LSAAFTRRTAFPFIAAALPALLPGVAWSDHWSFWRQRYPAVMITDTAPYRYEHYHQIVLRALGWYVGKQVKNKIPYFFMDPVFKNLFTSSDSPI
jgi:predicted aconitase